MKVERWIMLVALLSALVLIVGCAPKRATPQFAGDAVRMEKAVVEREVVVATPAPGQRVVKEGAGRSGSDLGSASEQMIIRTVNMTVVVKDTDETLEALRSLVKNYEGYFADSYRWLVNDQPYARVTLRVPAGSLDEVLQTVRGMVIKVQEENISGQDVTEEYVDLQARLRNLEATEKELLALLTEVRENRGKAEDILKIHRELTSIRGQIESLKGRKQYLERMTAMATLHIEIRPKEAPRPLVEKAKWSPLVTISKALRSFINLFQVLLDLIIYVLIFSPYVLIPVIVIWLLVRWIRRRKNK